MSFMSGTGSFMSGTSKRSMGVGAFDPTSLANLEAWYQFNTGITEAGQGVSVWADQAGNSRDLNQTTDGNRPSKESDGSILFAGGDEYLKTDAFTFNQPQTVYLLGRQVTWTNNEYIFDGEASFSMMLRQSGGGGTPNVRITTNGTIFTDANPDWILDTYAVVSSVFNGASSVCQIDKNTAKTGDAGVDNGGGFTLAVRGNAASGHGHIQIKEAILYSDAHDAATRTRIINYLSDVGGLGL